MIAWFARNPVAANLVMWAIIIGGLVMFNTSIILEVFPDSEAERISVNVKWLGATPEEMELGVVARIEEAVSDIIGIEETTSTSREGSASVVIEAEENIDVRALLGDIKSRVDSINTLPRDAELPIVALQQRRFTVIDVTLSGEIHETELLELAENVREELLQKVGLSYVDIQFGRTYEIGIEVPQHQLRAMNLTLSEISSAISSSSLDISAGNVRTRGGDVLIRSRGQAYRRGDFENIAIKTNLDGSIIRLGDIATINDGFEEDNISAKLNNVTSIFIRVYRVGSESALKIARLTKNYIEQKQVELPQGVNISYWDDDSRILKSRLSTLLTSMWQGGVLVILLLTLFLRPSVAFWVFIGIPISFIGSSIVLGSLGVSINILSLYGFIIVLGLVVDDAIVTGESIYTEMQKPHEDGTETVIKGTRRVAIPVTFGALTTMAAFLPMSFSEGFIGRLMSDVPIVVCSILIFSLIESKLVLPTHMRHIKRRDATNINRFMRYQQRFANGFERIILTYYRPLLRRASTHRYAVLAVFIGFMAIAIAMLSSGWMRFTFFPRVPSETIRATLTMPAGTPYAVTQRHIQNIADTGEHLRRKYTDANGNSVVSHILAVTGSSGGRSAAPSRGSVSIETLPVEERPIAINIDQMVNEWRELIGTINGAENLTFRAEILRPSDPIKIQLKGKSFDTLERVISQIKQQLSGYPTVFDISDTLLNGKEELQIDLNKQAEVLGLTRSSILRQVSEAFHGAQAQRVQRGRDDVRVVVRLPRAERENITTLSNMLIRMPSGGEVPLSNVATIVADKGPATINHIDGYRVVDVTADYDKNATNANALTDDIQSFMDQLLLNYPNIAYSLEGELKEQRESASTLQVSLIALLFFVYAMLALPLKSYTQPLIVMSIIPFGLIGAVIGHLIMGHSMTILSYLGLLALVGILVNDSLVLVDYVNKRRDMGDSIRDAILNSGSERFRAVMLTSLTTFFGLLPMMFATSTQSIFLVPMAISLGFGVIFATFMTLLLLPCIMLIGIDISNLSATAYQRLIDR